MVRTDHYFPQLHQLDSSVNARCDCLRIVHAIYECEAKNDVQKVNVIVVKGKIAEDNVDDAAAKSECTAQWTPGTSVVDGQ